MKDKAAVYYCVNVYQTLILTIMIELYYRDYKNVVVIEQSLAEKLNLDFLYTFADEIIVLTAEASEYEIRNQFLQIYKKDNVKMFGMFTWGINGAYIYNGIPKDVKVVLLDEGVSTCEYKKYMSCAVGDIDFSKIKEVWMIDPKISQNDKTVPEYRIALEQLFTNEERFGKYLEVVNQLYGYQHEELKGDVLFFDRYLVQLNRIPIKYERFMLESLVKMAGNKCLCVKPHPSEEKGLAEWRYRGLPVTFYENQSVPWELVVLNCIYHFNDKEEISGFPQVLMATNTTTLFITQTLLQTIGVEIPVIYINKVINKYLREVEVVAEKTLEEYKHVYKERKIFLPESWDELYGVLTQSLCLAPEAEILEEIRAKEIKVLSEEYRKTLKVEGSLLQRVYLEASFEDVLQKRKIEINDHSYIIGGENEYKVVFDKLKIENAKDITFRFFPAGIPPVYRNGILRGISYYRNGIKEIDNKDEEFIISNKVPYVEVELLSNGDKISSIEIEFTTEREYQVLFETEQNKRFQNYFTNMIRWVELLQKRGNCFEEYCCKKGYRCIGIYGNGKIGKLLYNQFCFTGLSSVLIDKKKFAGCMLLAEAITKLQEFDLIIVTPLFDYYNIHQAFGFSKKVIGLDDFLDAVKISD